MGSQLFSRGVALSRGADILGPDALIFFIDVDILFTCDTLDRVIRNTVRGAQVNLSNISLICQFLSGKEAKFSDRNFEVTKNK